MHTYPKEAREVLGQIVRDTRFRKSSTPPVLGLQMMAFASAGILLVGIGSWAYLQGHIPYLLMLVTNGYGMVMMFASVHEATHKSVSSIHWLNDLVGTAGGFLFMPGISTTVYRYLHLAHHRYTGDPEKDPDAQYVNAPFYQCLFRWATMDIHWGIWFVRDISARSTSERQAFYLGVAVFIAWYGGWLLSPYAMDFVLMYLIPQRVFYCVLLYFFAYVQHPPGILQSEQPFQATVILNVPKWVHPLLIFQDKHIIHHMFPALPFYRYPGVWAFARDLLEQQHIPHRGVIEWNWKPKIAKPASQSLLKVSIANIQNVADGVRSFDLVSSNDDTLPSFSAGAHIDVHIRPGLVRQYSLCNSPNDRERYVIAVKREQDGRGGSRCLHDIFAQGMDISISEPRNTFQLGHDASTYHLVAGGIGITPMLSMAWQLNHAGKDFTLHLFARAPEFLPFSQKLAKLPFVNRIRTYFDSELDIADRDIATIIGQGRADKELYICGPQPMMDLFINTATARDWDPATVRTEAFSNVEIDNSNNRPFELRLVQSRQSLAVAADETIIEALDKAGINVPVSCGQGLCGTCVCRVVDGEVDHRDAILDDGKRREENKMALCVSRAKSHSLSIDL